MLDEVDDLTPEQQMLVIQTEASMLAQAKRNQDSFDLLDKAVATWPDSTELIYDHALAAERVGKLDLMESQLRKVIKIKPDFASAYNAQNFGRNRAKIAAERSLHVGYFRLGALSLRQFNAGRRKFAQSL
jgi:tetratricopeptide (TPR) repeat protein